MHEGEGHTTNADLVVARLDGGCHISDGLQPRGALPAAIPQT